MLKNLQCNQHTLLNDHFHFITLPLSQLCLAEPTFAFEHQWHLLSETAVTFPAMIR